MYSKNLLVKLQMLSKKPLKTVDKESWYTDLTNSRITFNLSICTTQYRIIWQVTTENICLCVIRALCFKVCLNLHQKFIIKSKTGQAMQLKLFVITNTCRCLYGVTVLIPHVFECLKSRLITLSWAAASWDCVNNDCPVSEKERK